MSGPVEVTPSVVVVYEIPPETRSRFAAFQQVLRNTKVVTLGSGSEAWKVATEKNLMVRRFALAGVRHMETVSLAKPSEIEAMAAFHGLGRDVWTRPSIGMGGADIRHVTTDDGLRDACTHYARSGQDWQLARDARNFGSSGERRQYRVVVLDGRVIRACEHVQADPDEPCNESRGAVSTVVSPADVPRLIRENAIDATAALDLPLGGVDLAPCGAVFEVNVHPAFGEDAGFETMAVPYVQAHLARL